MKIAELLRANINEFGKLDTLDHGTPTQRANFLPSAAPENFEWAAYNARSLMAIPCPLTLTNSSISSANRSG